MKHEERRQQNQLPQLVLQEDRLYKLVHHFVPQLFVGQMNLL